MEIIIYIKQKIPLQNNKSSMPPSNWKSKTSSKLQTSNKSTPYTSEYKQVYQLS